MARGAAQARRKQAAQTQPKKKRQETWEDQLFFSRLRRHAKIAYVFLALVFAVGFVAFGVGSGSTGISGALQDLFNGSTGGGSSVDSRIKSDQKKLATNPGNAALYTDLATLYQQKNESSTAIRTLEAGAKANPKNLEILGALATAYRSNAEAAKTDAQNAQAALNSTFFTSPAWIRTRRWVGVHLRPGQPGAEARPAPASRSSDLLLERRVRLPAGRHRVARHLRRGERAAPAREHRARGAQLHRPADGDPDRDRAYGQRYHRR